MPGRPLAALFAACLAVASWQLSGNVVAKPAMLAGGNADSGIVAATRKPASPPAPATVVPDDPWWHSEWGLARIGMPSLWRVTEGAPSTVIAVVDTGVDASQPDLAGGVLTGYDPTVGSSATDDSVGHGTLVAEVAAGRGDNGVGGAGVCWHCSILPVRVAPNGTATAVGLAEGIRWAVEHGADVINISLVLTAADPTVGAAIEYAEQRGAIVVAAAGNDGSANPTYPAAFPGVIGVVATDAADHAYSWSTHGSWSTLAAPGCATVGDASGAVTQFCGSSAAAPLVSGLVGLLWSAGLHSQADIRSVLTAGSAPLDGSITAGGRVDAASLAARLNH
jgi:subtilisin family serine protease